jgi:8-oxo-dGTP diphosphatase
VKEHGIRASAIIIKDGRIALIHRHNHGKEYWTLPGGRIEEGETPEQAVDREVGEETNLEVITCRLIFYVDRFGNGIEDQPCFTCQTSGGRLEFKGPEAVRDPLDTYAAELVNTQKLTDLEIYPDTLKAKLLKIL